MLIFKLATRNLFRQFSRNALSMVSIIVGVMIIGVGRGFQNGLNENMIRGQIDSSSGHVMAVPTDYPTTGFRQPVSDAFALPPTQRTWLDDHTRAWTPRLIADPPRHRGSGLDAGPDDQHQRARRQRVPQGRLPDRRRLARRPGRSWSPRTPAALLELEPGAS